LFYAKIAENKSGSVGDHDIDVLDIWRWGYASQGEFAFVIVGNLALEDIFVAI
jgi:hypothetical protein